MTPDSRWESFGVTQEFLNEKSEWMSRDPGFRGTMIMYFKTAGSLMQQSWFDYTLVSAAFFHAVVGLEAMLRDESRTQPRVAFKKLLKRAVATGAVLDTTFSKPDRMSDELGELVGKRDADYPLKLASILPELRKDYLHGCYRLSPGFLPLAIHVKEFADAVWIRSST